MMKKYVSLLIFSIALLSAKAQIFQPQASYGFQYKRLKQDSTALIPTFCGVPNLRGSTIVNQSGIGYDSCGHVFYVYDPPSHTWISIVGGGGTGSRVDSITVIDSILCLWQSGASLCANLRKDTIRVGFGLGVTFDPDGKQRLFALHPDGLVSGGIVTSAGGLNIDITSAVYWKNFNPYISPARTIALAAASGSNPRKDVPIVDTTGAASILTGTAAANPLEPQPNPTSQLKLTTIDIPTGATSLNVITKFIYQEGITPWDTATAGTINAAFRNTSIAHLGTHSVYVKTYTDGSQLIFTDSGPDTVVSTTVLKFFLYLPNKLTNHLQLQLWNGAGSVSSNIDITPYLSPLDTLEWQNVSIPVTSAFSLPGGTIFNKLKLTHSGSDVSGANGYYLDDIQLQTGITQAQIDYSNKLDSVTLVDSTLRQWVKGVSKVIGVIHSSTGGGGITALTGDVLASGTGSVAATLARQLAPTAVKTTTYSAAVNDFIPCDNTGGSFTVTLPTAPADKSIIGVKLVILGGTNTITIAAGGSDVFNKAGGSTSLSLTLLNQAVILQYKASVGIWYVLSTDAPVSAFVTNVIGTAPIISSGGSTPAISADTSKSIGRLATFSDNAKKVNIADTAVMLTPYKTAYNNVSAPNDTTLRFIRLNGSTTDVNFAGISPAWGLSGNIGITNANFLGSVNNSSLRFRTNNIEYAVLDSNGKFGIGTPTPSGKLQIRTRGIGAAVPDSTSGLFLVNDSISTAGVPVQNSPAAVFKGHARATTGPVDWPGEWRIYNSLSSFPAPQQALLFASQLNSGSITTPFSISSTGIGTFSNQVFCAGVTSSGSVNVTGGNITVAGTITQQSGTQANSIASGLAIAGTTIDTSAVLDLQGTTRGLLIPRVTTTQMNGIIGGYGAGGLAPGSGQTNTTYTGKALTGGTGTGAIANITVAGGVVTSIVPILPIGSGYTVGDVLSAAGMGGTPFTYTLTNLKKPATGLLVYNTTLKRVCQFDGTSWQTPEYTSTGTAAPATTPLAVGDKFVDTTNKKIYFATGISSSADWTIVN